MTTSGAFGLWVPLQLPLLYVVHFISPHLCTTSAARLSLQYPRAVGCCRVHGNVHRRQRTPQHLRRLQADPEADVGHREAGSDDTFWECSNEVEDVWAEGIRATNGSVVVCALFVSCRLYSPLSRELIVPTYVVCVGQDLDDAWQNLLDAEARRSRTINAQIREFVLPF